MSPDLNYQTLYYTGIAGLILTFRFQIITEPQGVDVFFVKLTNILH